MTDITESLRALTVNDGTTSTLAVCEVAAREIERLRALLKLLHNEVCAVLGHDIDDGEFPSLANAMLRVDNAMNQPRREDDE